MTPSARDWLSGLRAFAEDYRLKKPIALPLPSDHATVAQRSILAADLTLWIDGEAHAVPPSHGIALTTTDLGIAVAEIVLGRDAASLATGTRDRIAAVREIEYRMWTKDHPDPGHLLHVNHWSWIKQPVPRQRWHEFRAFPLREGEAYWLHRTGTTGPGSTAARHAHLWKWTGSHAVLLKPFVREGVDAL